MIVRDIYSATENELCQFRSRTTSWKMMFFIFMRFYQGGNKGGIGLCSASQLYSISVGTFSSYI